MRWVERLPTLIPRCSPSCFCYDRCAGEDHEATHRTPSRRDPRRRCGRLLAADGRRRGGHCPGHYKRVPSLLGPISGYRKSIAPTPTPAATKLSPPTTTTP